MLFNRVSELVKQEVARRFGPHSPYVISALDLIPHLGEDPLGRDRIHLAVLLVSQDDLLKFNHAVQLASEDWRDILGAAGLENADWQDVLRRKGIELEAR